MKHLETNLASPRMKEIGTEAYADPKPTEGPIMLLKDEFSTRLVGTKRFYLVNKAGYVRRAWYVVNRAGYPVKRWQSPYVAVKKATKEEGRVWLSQFFERKLSR